MRKRLHLTLDDFSKQTGVARSVLSRLERGGTRKANYPWVLGRILPFLSSRFKEAFPESKGDPYDFIIPPSSFGSWLKNFRLRRGMKLNHLAKLLNVRPYTIIRYEAGQTKPAESVRQDLKRIFKLNGELDRFFHDHSD
ncbi:MAG: helix-turn-helix transcriptional regulator [Elusimicrobiota bacterium]